MFFDTLGVGYAYAGSPYKHTFQYNYNEWINVNCFINLDDDMAVLKIDGQELAAWQWRKGSFGMNNNCTIAALDFYGWNENWDSGYYLDDISFDIVSSISNRLLGSSSSIYTIEENWLNQIAVNNDLNTVAFIHRNNEDKFGGHSGQLRYDISTDGGINWQNDQGILNPASDSLTSARHPQIAIHNPIDNIDPENATLVYYAPISEGSVIDGYVSGAYALNGTNSTENYNQATSNYAYLPGGLIQTTDSTYFTIDKKYPYKHLRIFKSHWLEDDVRWEVADSVDISDYGYGLNSWTISFAPDGTTGWLAAMIRTVASVPGDFQFNIILYKTVDGGNSWNEATVLNFDEIPEIKNQIPEPYLASCINNGDFDLSVDINGNPHILTDVFAKDPDANAVYNSVFHKLYAFTYNNDEWITNEIAGLETAYYSLYTDNYWYLLNRLHICKSEDATNIYYLWTDSDSTKTENYQNSTPNLFGIGYDVTNNEWTEIKKFTEGSAVEEQIFAATASPIALNDGNQCKIPVVYARLSENGSPTDPVDFYYLAGVNFERNDCPEAFAGNDVTICQEDDYTIVDATADFYSSLMWTGGMGTFDDSTIINPTYTPAPSEYGTVVELCLEALPISPCNISAINCLEVYVQMGPVAIAGYDVTICMDDVFYIQGSFFIETDSIYWYSEGDGYFIDENSENPVYIPGPYDIGNGSVFLWVDGFSISPCQMVFSSYLVLTIQASPIVNAGWDAAICQGESYYISDAMAEFYSSLFWSSSSGTFDDPELLHPTYFPDPFTSGTMEVLCLEALPVNPCYISATDCLDLNIVEAPEVLVGEDATICEGEGFDLYGMLIYSWDSHWLSTGTGTFAEINNPETTYFPSEEDIQTGEVTLCLIGQPISPCSTSAMDCLELSIKRNPLVFAGEDAITCEDSDYCIEDAWAENYSEVYWTTNGDGGFSNPNDVNPCYYPGMEELIMGSSELHLLAQPLNPCYTNAEDFLTINFQWLPYATPGENKTVCEDNHVEFSDAFADFYSTVLWTGGAGYFDCPDCVNPIYFPASIEAGSTVELCLEAFPESPCLTSTFQCMELYVQEAPWVDAGTDFTVCDGDVITLDGISEHTSGCAWTSSGTGLIEEFPPGMFSYYPSTEDILLGNITLCMECSPIAPCEALVEDCFTVTFVPNIGITGNNPLETICESDPQFCFDSIEVMNYSSLEWTTTGDGFFDNPESVNPCYMAGSNDLESFVFILELTVVPLPGCYDTVFQPTLFLVQRNPVVFAGDDYTICQGGTFTNQFDDVSHCDDFFWSGGLGSFNDPQMLHPSYTPVTSEYGSTVSLLLTGQAISPCVSVVTDSMELYIQPKPTVNAGDDITICENQTVLLNGESQYSSACYWLSSGDGYFIESSNLNTEYIPSFTDIIEGEVTLCLICEAIDPCTLDVMSCIDVTFTPLPEIWIGMDESICEGESFYPMTIFADNISELLWSSNGDGAFDDPTIADPIYNPGILDIENGMVDLCLEGYPISPCESSSISCMTLNILKNPEVYAGADATICEDQAYCIEDAFADNYQNIIWSASEGSFDYPSSPNPCYFPPFEFFNPGMVSIMIEAEPLFPCSVYAIDFLELTIMENPEVMVGEDVTICEGESTEVFGSWIMASAWSWFTLGSGTFENPSSDYTVYFPSEEDIQNGYVTLCFNCEPIYPCTLFADDCMDIEIAKNAIVNAGEDIIITSESVADVWGEVENFEYAGWETSGDGVFIDPLQLATTYEPGPEDISSMHVTLTLFAQSISPCDAVILDSLELFIGKEHIVNLNSGWNGISTYLSPFNQELEELLSPIQNNIVIMQNFTQLYWPDYNINTIGNFNSYQGYSLKVDQNCTLPFIGTEQETTFTFEPGWNIMPVLTNCDVSVFEFLPEMGPAFVLAYEIGGSGLLWPAQGIYNLLAFKPGKAYMVKTTQQKNFTFPGCDKMTKEYFIQPAVPGIDNSPWQIPQCNPGYHIIGIGKEAFGEDVVKGNLIAAFTENGLCAGITVIKDGPTALLVNADDITTTNIDGFIEPEKMNFKLFKPETSEILPLAMQYDDTYADHVGKFKVNGISVIKQVLTNSGSESSSIQQDVSIYPNPSTGIFYISGIEDKSETRLTVLNSYGQIIIETILTEAHEFDLSSEPPGIYFVQIFQKYESRILKIVRE